MRRGVGIAIVALAAIACGHGGYPLLPRNVRESVHRDHPDCGGREIRGVDLGGGRYQVLACGLNVVYACATGAHSRWRSCAPEQTSGGYVVAGAPTAGGTVVVVAAPGVGGVQTVQAYPAQTAPATTAPATTAPATTAPAQAAPAGAPTREQIEAGIGQWIDGHRAEILACTGTPAALVEVSWDSSGVLTPALGGEMHGSAAEPCVVRILSGMQLNVAGQAGSMRHVVQ